MEELTVKREQLEKMKENLNELEKNMDQTLEDCLISKDDVLDELLSKDKNNKY